MGHISLTQHSAMTDHLSLAMILPRFLILGHLGFMIGFGIVIVGVLGATPSVRASPNPFNVYADVFPEQSTTAVSAHGFSCILRAPYYDYDPSETKCGLNSTTGAFSNVELTHASGLIHDISFTMRESTLAVGDLILLLELSDIRPRGVIIFTWRGMTGAIEIEHPSTRFSVFHRVRRVILVGSRS